MDLLKDPKGNLHPLMEQKSLRLVAWTISGKTWKQEGISARASELITCARRPGTLSHYDSSWRKFASWCDTRDADPTRCALALILDFLAELYEDGLAHNTIAGYRSAISAFHEPIEGQKVGDHPRVSALMTGIFNLRPPAPKYLFIWDVEKVLNYIKSIPQNGKLSLKILTLKLATLLALTSASRASELCYLDVGIMTKNDEKYIFGFSRVTKSSRPKKPRPEIKFTKFHPEPKLCAYQTS